MRQALVGVYARPDDRSDDGRSWRKALLDYNRAPGANPLISTPLTTFCDRTDKARGERIVFYNFATGPALRGCIPRRYDTTTRTNWHYECANAFLDGDPLVRE